MANLLGLVSEKNIYMDGDPYGPNCDTADETVMAAIMALDESFTVEDHNQGSPRGDLPTWQEIGIAAAVIGYGFLLFSLSYRYLPIFPKEIELNQEAA